ncbi:hypothetical protein BDV25DRAFT_136765 [Aspergillus avenaceus]|uniref:Polyketide synthase n=1 Tax=Aspergillus avenaceus TaxID=36643 RepID=A0A5N6U4X1_ASPAV|nr:hypothetical protein BDV25DRAFT_136765 [Aspergillus avenaceus]
MSNHKHPAPEPIAITGMSCRFSGEASSVEDFWKMLRNGRTGHGQVPSSRFNGSAWRHPHHDRKGTINHDSGFFLNDGISRFDAPFFSITAKEAAGMDPLHRLLLEVAYETFENGGVPIDNLPSSKTAVYTGCMGSDYEMLSTRDPLDMAHNAATGTERTMLANRISWFFDLRGPSIMLDTACSSSLTALHLATQALRAGECDMALVTGACLIFNPMFSQQLSSMHMLSADGISHSFDAKANGYARGEGVGAVLLKRVSSAVSDGDSIRAIIRATAVNQDGRTPGITMPNSKAQADLIRTVYGAARADMKQTTYFEAHGTGTPLGDPTELAAIGETLGSARTSSDDPLYVGSVKRNIGHTEGAAGVASLIKTVLCLENGMLVPNPGLERLNPKLRLDEWHIRTCNEAKPWPAHLPQRASINSFGFGGANAHAIIESASEYFGSFRPSTCPQIVVFSTHDKAGLGRMGQKWSNFLRERVRSRSPPSLQDMAYTMFARRSHLAFRTFAVVTSLEQMLGAMDQGLPTFQRAGRSNQSNLAFVFTGQGAQWPGMGRQLLNVPVFAQSIERSNRALAICECPWDLVEALTADSESSKITQPDQSQAICCALQIALVDLLNSWGAFPKAVVGHSSGEIAAAYAAGYLLHEDAIRIAYFRGVYSQRLSQSGRNGGMMAAGISVDGVTKYLDVLPSRSVVVACVNSDTSITLSGDTAQIDKLEKALQNDGYFARRLRVNVAYHSPHMAGIADAYKTSIERIKPQDKHQGAVTLVSSVTQERVNSSDLSSPYWVRNLTSPVQFAGAVAQLSTLSVAAKGRRRSPPIKWSAFIEIGPHEALKGPFNQTLQAVNSKLVILPYCAPVLRNRDALQTALAVAGTLWSTGHAIDLDFVNQSVQVDTRQVLTDLPSYPWNHETSFWHEPLEASRIRHRQVARHDLLGMPVNYQNDLEPQWRHFLRLSENPWIADHVVAGSIVYPAAGSLAMVIEAARQLADHKRWFGGIEFQDVEFIRGVVIPADDRGLEVLLRVTAHPAMAGWYQFNVSSLPADGSWTLHVKGIFTILYDDAAEHESQDEWERTVKRIREFEETAQSKEKDHVYDWISQTGGVTMGPAFRSLTGFAFDTDQPRIWVSGRVPDTRRTMPHEQESPSVIHPTTLDSLFQAAVLSSSKSLTTQDANIPVAVDRLFISTSLRPEIGDRFSVFAEARDDDGLTRSHCVASDENWSKPWISLEGVRLGRVAIPKGPSSEAELARSQYSYMRWMKHVDTFGIPEPDSSMCTEQATHSSTRPQLRDLFERFCGTYADGRALVVVAGDSNTMIENLRPVSPGSSQHPCLLQITVALPDTQVKSDDTSEAVKRALPGASVLPLSALHDLGSQDITFDLLVIDQEDAWRRYATDEHGSSMLPLLPPGGWIALKVASAAPPELLETIKNSEDLQLIGTTQDNYALARRKMESQVHDTEVYALLPPGLPSTSKIIHCLTQSLSKIGINLVPIGLDQVDRVSGKATISFIELQEPWVVNWTPKHMSQFKEFVKAKYILWVSPPPMTGARGSVGFGATTGLLRTLRNESHGSIIPNVYLEWTNNETSSVAAVRGIMQVLTHTLLLRSNRVDMEFYVSGGSLLVPRVMEASSVQEAMHNLTHGPQPKLTELTADSRPLKLSVDSQNPESSYWLKNNSLHGILLPEAVEVQVEHITISNVSNRTSSATNVHGFEAVGTVIRTGSRVRDFVAGDKVLLASPAPAELQVSTIVQVPRDAVYKLAPDLSPIQAVSIPFIYTIAYASLDAHANAGSLASVLVVGDVSQTVRASVDVALAAQKQVFVAVPHQKAVATVISEYPEIKGRVIVVHGGMKTNIFHLTSGHGVDAVMSSYGGDAGRAAARCLAFGGKYIDISDDMKLDALPSSFVRRGCSFYAFKLQNLLQQTPERFYTLFQRTMNLVQTNQLMSRVHPYQVFPVSDVPGAFKYCADSGNRAILDLKAPGQVPVVPAPAAPVRLPVHHTYLLPGGLGTLGMALADTLIECGARHLVFLLRSGALGETQKRVIDRLVNRGCTIDVVQCDISKKENVHELMLRARRDGWQIKGIIQCTTVLRDALFENMTYESWTESTISKIQGTLHLDQSFSDADLKFFITLSSVASVMGNMGQANYAAGNAFMDSLMVWRRNRGLPGNSINIGLVPDASGIGDVSETPEERLRRYSHLQGTEIEIHEIQSLIRIIIGNSVPVPAQVIAGMTDKLSREGPTSWQLDRKFDHRIQFTSSQSASAPAQMALLLKNTQSIAEAAGIVSEALREYLARAMTSTADAIDPELPLSALGVDSLKTNEVQNWVIRELGAELNTFEFLGSQPLRTLAERIATVSSFVKVAV